VVTVRLVLDGPRLTDPGVVGHKFARQEVLRRAGFPVPELFCVPAEAFDAALAAADRVARQPGPAGGTAGPADPAAAAAALAAARRAAILAQGVPEQLAAAVRDGFDRLVGRGGLVAVRACVLPGRPGVGAGSDPDAGGLDGGDLDGGDFDGGEDGDSDPFAGLSDSFLYVGRGAVVRRVADCWASAFNAPAVLYRLRRGTDPAAARVAVGVQRMVDGRRSFVAFTRDPRDGTDRLVVAAAYGIGEGVVQEHADIDHFFLDPRTGAVRGTVVAKRSMVTLDPAEPAAGPRALPVPAPLVDRAVLSDDEVRQVGALAGRTERHFGVPQDIEGTLTADGAIHLLQARPMVLAGAEHGASAGPPGTGPAGTGPAGTGPAGTGPAGTGPAGTGPADEATGAAAGGTGPAGTEPAGTGPAGTGSAGTGPADHADAATGGTGPAGTIWTNHNLTESFPGVTCALTFSQACEFYELAFGDAYRRVGVPATALHRHAADLRRMIGLLDGRAYYRLDSWYALHGLSPGFVLMRSAWQRTLGLSGAELTDAPPLRRSLWTVLRAAPQLAVLLARHPRSVRGFLQWWDRLASTTGPLDECDADELVVHYRRMWSEVGDRWGVTLVNGFFLLVSLNVAERLLTRWVGADGAALLPGFLGGGRENRSLAAMRSALAIAEQMRRTPSLPATLRAGDDRGAYQEIAAGRFGANLAAALADHLRRYGDRTVHDLKLEVRTPRQEPWQLLALLRPLVEQELTVAGSLDAERRARREAAERLRRGCRSRARRAVLRGALATLRWFIRAREDTRFCRTELYGLTRDIMLRLGAELVGAGRLDAADDVIHLTVPEVLGAVDGTLCGHDLRGLVAVRRAELTGFAGRPPRPAYLRIPPGAAGTAAASAGSTTPGPAPVATPSTVDDPGPGGGRTLRGLASSSGLVRARARVVLEPSVAADGCTDHILVARETDPGWLYLMLAAKGIVVERGSILSHTAITGRLLGIPTVVAVPDATTSIPDGSLIELDGSAGTVRLLPDPAAGQQPVAPPPARSVLR
jgi:pyruvate,water dikinase